VLDRMTFGDANQGRTAYWDDEKNIIVILDPNGGRSAYQ
jgi:hypothetical protein